jgi:hypothetical protein
MNGQRVMLALLGVAASLGLMGCGSGVAGTGQPLVKPTVTLTANPAPFDVATDTSLTLTWSASDADAVGASNFGAGAVSGSKTLDKLAKTTTYSLTLSGPGGTTTQYCTVYVLGTHPDNTQALAKTWSVSAARGRALLYTTKYEITTSPASLRKYDLDANNQKTNEVVYNGTNATVTYDGTNKILSITDVNHPTPLRYAVNNLGRLIENSTADESLWRDTGAE